MSAANILDALRDAVGFEPLGPPAANLTIGKGVLDDRPLRVALVENRIASGSIGKAEVAKLVPLFAISAREKSPVVLFLDSAGARVSEGLEALGAFRRLFREALAARVAGAPVAAVLGRNCFGGASMLAPPKQLRPSTAHTGAPATRAATASRKRRRKAPSAASPSETRAPAESR